MRAGLTNGPRSSFDPSSPPTARLQRPLLVSDGAATRYPETHTLPESRQEATPPMD